MVLASMLAVASVLVASLVPAAADAGPPRPEPSCSEVRLPVALTPGRDPDLEVAGTMCLPEGEPTSVQVLVPGATYGRAYWDFPVMPERHSWVRFAISSGYATLALDRIGTGASSHPPPEEVTVTSSAFVVHQVVQALRGGRLGAAFSRVVLVGHSLGSVIALSEAANFDDVDTLVLTGFLHRIDAGFGGLAAAMYPARLDDQSRFGDLPPGYLTTRPGERRKLFYYEATSDGRVVAADEATKETITDGESLTLGRHLHEASMRISIPVLIVVGDRDPVFCRARRCSEEGGSAQREASFWSTSCYSQQVVPDTGHSLNLHTTAPRWLPAVGSWLAANGPDQVPAGCRRSSSAS